MHKEFGVVRPNVSNLFLGNAMLPEELETSSSTDMKVEIGLTEDLDKTCDVLGKIMGKNNVLIAKIDEL